MLKEYNLYIEKLKENKKINILKIIKGKRAFDIIKIIFFNDNIKEANKWSKNFKKDDIINSLSFSIYKLYSFNIL
jgi:hypothetical protein